MTKRQLVGCALVLCAVMMAFVGCSTKSSDADEIKVGVLYSTTGNFSSSETPMLNAAKMAIDEINEAGGIDGKQIKPYYVDYGSEPSVEADKAQQLILEEGVCAIVGT